MDSIEKNLLNLTRQFLIEMDSSRAANAVSVSASLERDLGIGSLERAELFHRIEKHFEIQLPEDLLGHIQTLDELLSAIKKAHPPEHFSQKEIITLSPASSLDLSQAQTLLDVLQLHAEREPDRPHIYLQDEYGEENIISYGELYLQAQKTAQGIIEYGVKPGETVALMSPTSKAFFYAFFGTLIAGAVPVPIYPPFRLDRIEEYAKRESRTLNNAGVRLLITFAEAEHLSHLLQAFIPSLIAVTTVPALQQSNKPLPGISIDSSDAGLIQYTSGSTGDPKGVLLNHENLLANIRAYGKAAQVKPTDVTVSWLPLYHDMGLIGAWLGSLYYGLPLTLLSPLTFLARPERWLWAIHYHRGTLSAAPNFAYELCLNKIEPQMIEGLDLSSWRMALNGAEAIYPHTLHAFTERFAKYGFKKTTLLPAYGLAECCVALSYSSLDEPPKIDRIQHDVFLQEGTAHPCAASEKNLEFVCCGKAIPDHEIRIVNAENQLLPERQVGQIQFKGPSAMQGYYRNPTATAAVYHQGWWDTGDLGYLAEGELYVTGRKKDLIIKAGRNYYPEEIEALARAVSGVRKGGVIAFGLQDTTKGTEKIILVAEKQAQTSRASDEIIADISGKISEQLGIPPDHVFLVAPNTIPKTSSGKLQRSELKKQYLAGQLGKTAAPGWRQILKLVLSSIGKRMLHGCGRILKSIYALYVGLLMLFTFLPTWLTLLLLPQNQARKLTRFWARNYLRLAACPLNIHGQQHLTTHKAIYIANHASYIDTLVLVAILPSDSLFIGKKELLAVPILSSLIKKLGHLTVDRMDFSKNMQDTQKITSALEQGRSLVFFPEGTFTYVTGIRPFKMGAFIASTKTQTPLCPIALKGTRTILRASRLLPAPGAITITILPPISPTADNWQEGIRLRNVSRKQIANYADEHTLDLLDVQIPTDNEKH